MDLVFYPSNENNIALREEERQSLYLALTSSDTDILKKHLQKFVAMRERGKN